MQTPHHRLATMPEHQVNAACVLLDIEGTTSSIAFVHDVMFPFARKHAREYLEHHFDDDAVQQSLRLLGADLGHGPDASWLVGSREEQIESAAAGMFKLMDGDVKATGLKQLQGLIWKDGFTRGKWSRIFMTMSRRRSTPGETPALTCEFIRPEALRLKNFFSVTRSPVTCFRCSANITTRRRAVKKMPTAI